MRAFLFWCCVLLYGAGAAQELVLRHINEDLGLPSDCVLDLFVDREGLLWVSTNKGLYRYDGFHYEQVGKGTPLEEVNIVTIKEVPQLDMILLAAYGNRLFLYRGDSIHEVDLSGIQVKKFDHGALSGLVLDAENRLHFALTQDRGHWVIDLRTEMVEEVTSDNEGQVASLEEVGGHPFTSLANGDRAVSKQGSVRIRSYQGNVPMSGQCGLGSLGSGTLADGRILLWHCQNLFVFEDGAFIHRELPGRLLGVTEDRAGRIWVRMWEAGLLCFDARLNPLPLGNHQLTNTHVTACVQDRQGCMWFSTIDRGLFQCVAPDVQHYSARDELEAPWASSLLPLPGGAVACGTGNGQLYRIGAAPGVECLMTKADLGGSLEVKGVMLSPDSVILPGRLTSGWSLKEERIVRYEDRVRRWENVYALSRMEEQRSLMATIQGTRVVNLGPHPFEGPEVSDARTYALVRDRSGEGFFLGTHNGVEHVRFQDTTFVHVPFSGPRDRTYDLLAMGDSLWMATAKGLFLQVDDETHSVPLSGPVPHPQVRALALQDGRWLWVATLDGLYRMDLHDPATRPDRYGRAQGLPSESIFDVVVQPDRIWMICGPDVVSMPSAPSASDAAGAPLVILDILGNEMPGEGAVPRFPYTVERVSIALRNHDFVRHSTAPFRYRTSPDAAWSFTASPEIRLVGLDPRAYRLEIQAVNAEGEWSTPVFASWIIVPPFWETLWFQVLAGVVALALVSGAVLYVRERRHRESLLAGEALRYHHMALLAQMEPHFIFNALNSIQGFMARNDGDASARYLAKFAKLMRGLLNAAHNEQVTLGEETVILGTYCDLESLRSLHAFQYTIVVDPQLDQLSVMLPSFLVQPYVENAIRHGLRNLPDLSKGILTITFTKEAGEVLRIVVQDNGVGMAAAARVTQQGDGWRSHGTRINSERLQLLRKQGAYAQAGIHTEDLLDGQGLALGTRVVIDLPIILRKSHSMQATHG